MFLPLLFIHIFKYYSYSYLYLFKIYFWWNKYLFWINLINLSSCLIIGILNSYELYKLNFCKSVSDLIFLYLIDLYYFENVFF